MLMGLDILPTIAANQVFFLFAYTDNGFETSTHFSSMLNGGCMDSTNSTNFPAGFLALFTVASWLSSVLLIIFIPEYFHCSLFTISNSNRNLTAIFVLDITDKVKPMLR
jgi:hypothetical protein